LVYPDELVIENGIPQSVRDGLASLLGHNVQVNDLGLDNAHGLTAELRRVGQACTVYWGILPSGLRGRGGGVLKLKGLIREDIKDIIL
jgi:hypothetical protein